MARKFAIPQLAHILNATSLELPFLDVATSDQKQDIESKNMELKELSLNHYNASLFISKNQAIKKVRLPPGYKRPSIISTCASTVLTEDLVRSVIAWTPTQRMALENDITRDMAKSAANKMHMDAAIWLHNFLFG